MMAYMDPQPNDLYLGYAYIVIITGLLGNNI